MPLKPITAAREPGLVKASIPAPPRPEHEPPQSRSLDEILDRVRVTDDPPYVVICISTYPADLRRLDAMVRELKRRGYTKANRSALIRVAIDQLDLDRVPRGM